MEKLTKKTLKKHSDYNSKSFRSYFNYNNVVQLTVTNDTKKEIRVNLFGAVDEDKNSHKHIKADSWVTYSEILKTLLSKTLYIDKMRLSSTNVGAISNPIALKSKNIYGQSLSDPINPSSHISPFQIQERIIEIEREFVITENVSLLVTVPAKTSVLYSFFDSKFAKFKHELIKDYRNPFNNTLLGLLGQADFILKQFSENPYLHKNEGMEASCVNMRNKIYQWINDETFKYAYHKNIVDMYNILEPFVSKYIKIVEDANPLLNEFMRERKEGFLKSEKLKKVVLKKVKKQPVKKAVKTKRLKLK